MLDEAKRNVIVNGMAEGPRGLKRSADSDDESSYQPPANDLYRARQQKRNPVGAL